MISNATRETLLMWSDTAILIFAICAFIFAVREVYVYWPIYKYRAAVLLLGMALYTLVVASFRFWESLP